MPECQLKAKQNKRIIWMHDLYTDSNSLAPYETLCSVLEVFLICKHLCLYSNCSGEGTYDSGPGGSER